MNVVASQAALADVQLCCVANAPSIVNYRGRLLALGGGDGRMAIILAMSAMVVENRDYKKQSS